MAEVVSQDLGCLRWPGAELTQIFSPRSALVLSWVASLAGLSGFFGFGFFFSFGTVIMVCGKEFQEVVRDLEAICGPYTTHRGMGG